MIFKGISKDAPMPCVLAARSKCQDCSLEDYESCWRNDHRSNYCFFRKRL